MHVVSKVSFSICDLYVTNVEDMHLSHPQCCFSAAILGLIFERWKMTRQSETFWRVEEFCTFSASHSTMYLRLQFCKYFGKLSLLCNKEVVVAFLPPPFLKIHDFDYMMSHPPQLKKNFASKFNWPFWKNGCSFYSFNWYIAIPRKFCTWLMIKTFANRQVRMYSVRLWIFDNNTYLLALRRAVRERGQDFIK